MELIDMVREYVDESGQHPNEEMSIKLIKEEFFEWREEVIKVPHSPEEELKELSDLVYVIYGYSNTMGWDLSEAVSRVHSNNMGRMKQDDGTIKRREDGKIMKNKNYPKVDLKDLV